MPVMSGQTREDTMHRMLLIACFTAAAAGTAVQAQTMSAACAERDLRVIAFIEEHGEAGDLPDATLGELGLMHLQARLNCIAGREARALLIYDDILNVARTAEWVGS
jgi:hypothetical protein